MALRERTPGEYLFNEFDEKFGDELLNEEGNQFAEAYYMAKKAPAYLTDYEDAAGKDVEDLYRIPDTWATFDKLRPILDKRFANWKNPPKKGLFGLFKKS